MTMLGFLCGALTFEHRLSMLLLAMFQNLRLETDEAKAALNLLLWLHRVPYDRTILAAKLPTVVKRLADIINSNFVGVTIFAPFKLVAGDNIDRRLALSERFVYHIREMTQVLLPGLAQLCTAYCNAAIILRQDFRDDIERKILEMEQEIQALKETLLTQFDDLNKSVDAANWINLCLVTAIDDLNDAKSGLEFVQIGGGVCRKAERAVRQKKRRVDDRLRIAKFTNQRYMIQSARFNNTQRQIVEDRRLIELQKRQIEQLSADIRAFTEHRQSFGREIEQILAAMNG